MSTTGLAAARRKSETPTVRLAELGYYTSRTAAAVLGISPRRVRRMAERGILPRVTSDIGYPLYPTRPVLELAVMRLLPATVAGLAVALEVSERAVRRALADLYANGLVEATRLEPIGGRPAMWWSAT